MSAKQRYSKVRGHARGDISSLVYYTHYHPDAKKAFEGVAKAVDISEGGVRIEINHAMEVGTTLDLEIAIKNDILPAKGEVIHVLQTADDHYSIGIYFSEIDEKSRKLVRKHLRELA
jgi:hypothetical protein